MCNDPKSWPKEFSSFKDLETLLKCGICYEYFSTAIITPCSHNYCSYCIRKSLLYKTQCPSCSEETTESQLRNNRVLDEIVAIFTGIQDKLLKYLGYHEQVNIDIEIDTISEQAVPIQDSKGKQYVLNNKSFQENVLAASSLSSSPVLKRNNSVQYVGSTDPVPTSSHDHQTTPKRKVQTIASMFSPKVQKNSSPHSSSVSVTKVSCPVCSVEISEQNINIHLDACLKRAEQGPEQRSRKNEKRKPLPKLVYTLLHEKVLRKKLGELGLSTQGDRKALVNRHKRFTLLYNSECDSLNPRPVSEILQKVEREEKEEKKASSTTVQTIKLNVDRKADPKVIEEAQQEYLQQHKSSFRNLIQSIRNRNADLKNPVSKIKEKDDDEQTVVSLSSDHSIDEDDVKSYKRQSQRKKILSDSESESSEENKTLNSKLKKSPELNAEKEVYVIESGSATSCSEASCHSPTVSPVLRTRFRPHTTPSTKAKLERENRSITPDMFEERTRSLSLPGSDFSVPAGQEGYKSDSDNSEGSISLMIYHTEVAEQNKELTNAPQGEVETIETPEAEANVTQEEVKMSKTPQTEADVPQVEGKKIETHQAEPQLNYGFEEINFDFDFDNLLKCTESQHFLTVPNKTVSPVVENGTISPKCENKTISPCVVNVSTVAETATSAVVNNVISLDAEDKSVPSDGDKGTILPTRRRSKRKPSTATSNPEDVVPQRTLRKRVKR